MLVSSTTLPSGLTAPSLTVTTAFTATGLVTNADLANAATTVNGQTCTLGSTCTVTATASSALTIGTHLTGTSYNGSTPVTIATDAVSTNTNSTIVARDGSGNFAAGTITASLTGGASLDLHFGRRNPYWWRHVQSAASGNALAINPLANSLNQGISHHARPVQRAVRTLDRLRSTPRR